MAKQLWGFKNKETAQALKEMADESVYIETELTPDPPDFSGLQSAPGMAVVEIAAGPTGADRGDITKTEQAVDIIGHDDEGKKFVIQRVDIWNMWTGAVPVDTPVWVSEYNGKWYLREADCE